MDADQRKWGASHNGFAPVQLGRGKSLDSVLYGELWFGLSTTQAEIISPEVVDEAGKDKRVEDRVEELHHLHRLGNNEDHVEIESAEDLVGPQERDHRGGAPAEQRS